MSEQLCACLIMVVAVSSFGELLGSITAITVDSQSEHLRIQQRVRSATKFMRQKEIPAELRRRVRRYVKHVCEVESKTAGDADVLGIIRGPLQDEVITTIIKKTINRSSIFRNAPKALRQAICECCVCVRLEPGELVVQEGAHMQGIWILSTGRVQLVEGDNLEPLGDHGTSLSDGSFFGERTLSTLGGDEDRPTAPCSAQCVTHCDFVHLDRERFFDLMQNFPDAEKATFNFHENAPGSGIPCALCREIGHWAIDCQGPPLRKTTSAGSSQSTPLQGRSTSR